MKKLIILLFPFMYLIGCTSSSLVTSADQYEEINAQAAVYRATITIQADSATVEYEGDSLSINRDSVLWVDPGTGLGRSATTVNLRRIRFIKQGTGALEGLAFGAMPGAVFLALYSSGSKSSGEGKIIYGGISFVGIIGGVIIGTVTGAIIGHKTDYIFSKR